MFTYLFFITTIICGIGWVCSNLSQTYIIGIIVDDCSNIIEGERSFYFYVSVKNSKDVVKVKVEEDVYKKYKINDIFCIKY